MARQEIMEVEAFGDFQTQDSKVGVGLPEAWFRPTPDRAQSAAVDKLCTNLQDEAPSGFLWLGEESREYTRWLIEIALF